MSIQEAASAAVAGANHGVSYVLAQQDLKAPERIGYLQCWTAIGPCGTWSLDEAQRFDSEQAAMDHPAFSFPLTFYKPCPVLGDMVARPAHWLDAEMAAERQVLIGEDPEDGLRVFA